MKPLWLLIVLLLAACAPSAQETPQQATTNEQFIWQPDPSYVFICDLQENGMACVAKSAAEASGEQGA